MEPVRTASAKRPQKSPTEESKLPETVANSGRDEKAVIAKSSSQEAAPAPQQPQAGNSKTVVTGTLEASNTGTASTSVPNPRNTLPTAKDRQSKSFKGSTAATKPALIRPTSAPQPLRDGQSTLRRTRGLETGRLANDAGQTGHGRDNRG